MEFYYGVNTVESWFLFQNGYPLLLPSSDSPIYERFFKNNGTTVLLRYATVVESLMSQR